MTLIVAISGKKQAGKNTVAEYVRHASPASVGLYSYADKLKQFCIECLGLSQRQCYGSDDDKNTPTNLRWEDMPGVTTNKKLFNTLHDTTQAMLCVHPDIEDEHYKLIYHTPGIMTAREVMQFFGTEIGRRMYNNIWVDATIRQIKMDRRPIAIITDCRFPNEVKAVLDAKGVVIRLTRNIFGNTDVHESELVLDIDRFNWDLFTWIVDNQEMSIDDTNALVYSLIEKAYNEKQKATRRNTVLQDGSDQFKAANPTEELWIRDGAF